MANGKRFKGPISDRELRQAKRLAGRRSGNGGLQKALGMTQRPTTAGQARFGDVDVDGGGRGGRHNYVIPPASEEQRQRILGAIGRPLKRMGRGALKMAKRAARR